MPNPPANALSLSASSDAPDKLTLRLLAERLEALRSVRNEIQPKIVIGTQEFALSAPVTELLEDITAQLASGNDLTVVPRQTELTTSKAAELLNISRQYLVRLCDAGELPFRLEGTHRRLALKDVLAYREVREVERVGKFRQLVADSVLSGEYDAPIVWPPE